MRQVLVAGAVVLFGLGVYTLGTLNDGDPQPVAQVEVTTTAPSTTLPPTTTTTLPPTTTTVPPTTAPPTTVWYPPQDSEIVVVTPACDTHAPYNDPVNADCWMTEEEFVEARIAEIANDLPGLVEGPVP